MSNAPELSGGWTGEDRVQEGERRIHAAVMLDTGPLGYVTHPRTDIREEAGRWLAALLRAGTRVVIPEISDYELRRELVRAGKEQSVGRLDKLGERLVYLPLKTSVMRRAAVLWADAQNRGGPTAPDPALDGDVILAAQTLTLEEEISGDVYVATTNPDHLSRYVAAGDWRDIGPAIKDEE